MKTIVKLEMANEKYNLNEAVDNAIQFMNEKFEVFIHKNKELLKKILKVKTWKSVGYH